MDDPEHLVRGRDHGTIVTPLDHEHLVIALELPSQGAGGTMGAFGKVYPQVLVPLSARPERRLPPLFLFPGHWPGAGSRPSLSAEPSPERPPAFVATIGDTLNLLGSPATCRSRGAYENHAGGLQNRRRNARKQITERDAELGKQIAQRDAEQTRRDEDDLRRQVGLLIAAV